MFSRAGGKKFITFEGNSTGNGEEHAAAQNSPQRLRRRWDTRWWEKTRGNPAGTSDRRKKIR